MKMKYFFDIIEMGSFDVQRRLVLPPPAGLERVGEFSEAKGPRLSAAVERTKRVGG